MRKRTTSEDKFSQLRKQAEKMMTEGYHVSKVVSDDPLKLIHELQTLQFELEVQNDELRNSQQDLIQSQNDYSELYEFAPVGYATVSAEGLILKTNLTFSDMISTEKIDIINQPMRAFIHNEDQKIYHKYLKDLSDSKILQVCELRLKKKNSTPFYAQLESAPVFDKHQGPNQYRMAIIDISKRKQAEQELAKHHDYLEMMVEQRTAELQQEVIEHQQTQEKRLAIEIQLQHARRMEIIGTLAGGIAHDFNNILYPIIGFTELSIEDLPENHPIKENLEDVLRGALRASSLVKQISTFSSQCDEEQKPVMLKSVIKEAINFLRSTIPSNIKIQHEFFVNSEIILGNSTKIYEVIMNLFTNAFHAMEEEGGAIKVILNKAESVSELNLPSGEYCCLSISDTGTGIPQEIINKIYDPYFTTKKLGKGSGLGLSVVQGIVRNHNGAITVKSDPGKGTVFNVYLPMVLEAKTPDETPDKKPYSIGSESILFVDDEILIVKFGTQLLMKLGYKVTGTTSCVEALTLFESDPDIFDLVITDMSMPEISGVLFAKELLKTRPDIPIIICSGFSDGLDTELVKALGIRDYIKKPILSKELASKVRKILDQAKKG